MSNRMMIRSTAASSVKRKLVALTASLMVAGSLLAAPAVGTAMNNNSYTPSGWALEDANEAFQIGLVPTELWSNFQSSITRAELSQVIVCLYERLTAHKAELPAGKPFKDTKDPYVLKAYALGIVGGTGGGNFSPHVLVTREQLAVMLDNTLVKAGFQNELKGDQRVTFADTIKISSWATSSATKLAAAGILKGSESKSGLLFQPKANASREQIFVLAYRVADRFGPRYVKHEGELLTAVEHRGKSIIFTDDRMKMLYEKATDILHQIIKPDMTEFDKELAIHDYLVLHTAYDYDHYLTDTVPADSYSAYGVLFKGTAVCQGYANAAQLLLELAGIDSQIVYGMANGDGHAWNKVNIGGDDYNLDVTWDDPVPDIQGQTNYAYFNVTDEELARDHTWETSSYPAASATSLNYYVFKDLVVHSKEELRARLTDAIANRVTTLTFKTDLEDDVDRELANVIGSGVVSSIGCNRNSDVYVIQLKYR
ncbi:S-layer homology domain-containing protein [Gorillibacterium timonense]|uniref:S-layer homology domain-containing protein n=1 Tax=Gorillibacterium timonense TaxID=1689269 RepID=UPI00071E3754|nr:S-layer homology domain-containing protein [Gorillibacterium timonense]